MMAVKVIVGLSLVAAVLVLLAGCAHSHKTSDGYEIHHDWRS